MPNMNEWADLLQTALKRKSRDCAIPKQTALQAIAHLLAGESDNSQAAAQGVHHILQQVGWAKLARPNNLK